MNQITLSKALEKLNRLGLYLNTVKLGPITQLVSDYTDSGGYYRQTCWSYTVFIGADFDTTSDNDFLTFEKKVWGVVLRGESLREGNRLSIRRRFFSTATKRHTSLDDAVRHRFLLGLETLPGQTCKRDRNGVCFVRQDGTEYHPTSAEWCDAGLARVVAAKQKEARQRRIDANKQASLQKRHEAIFAREMSSTRVTLEDSRKAGNCVEGSLSFAQRKLGVDRQTVLGAGYLFSLPATLLLANANGDKRQVEAAVRVAFARETTVSI